MVAFRSAIRTVSTMMQIDKPTSHPAWTGIYSLMVMLIILGTYIGVIL